MKRIYYASDLHMEIGFRGFYQLKESSHSENDVLILAGDVTDSNFESKLQRINDDLNFKKIIYIPGNHEFYGGTYSKVIQDIELFVRMNCPKIVFLNNSYYNHEGIIFISALGWTSYDNQNPHVMFNAKRFMNDYHKIKWGEYQKLRPEDIYDEHINSFNFIEDTLDNFSSRKGVVVITHHAPSFKSIADRFKRNPREFDTNFCFAEPNYEKLIYKYKPEFWIHGHVHDSFDYYIDQTRVLCNPFGYEFYEENKNFSGNKFFEIEKWGWGDKND